MKYALPLGIIALGGVVVALGVPVFGALIIVVGVVIGIMS
jgi:hypothetical protein